MRGRFLAASTAAKQTIFRSWFELNIDLHRAVVLCNSCLHTSLIIACLNIEMEKLKYM